MLPRQRFNVVGVRSVNPGGSIVYGADNNTIQNMTPAQAAQILAQYGINPAFAGQLGSAVQAINMLGGSSSNGNGGTSTPLLSPGGAAPSPSWRDGQIAPGVEQPQEGLVALPMNAQSAAGIFSATVPQIIYQGQLQKPYRAERFIIQVARTGSSATNAFVQGQIFVGTDLQQGDITPILLEPLGQATAFGTRMTLMQAPPGVLIRIITSLTAALAGSDTIAVSMQWLGRIIH